MHILTTHNRQKNQIPIIIILLITTITIPSLITLNTFAENTIVVRNVTWDTSLRISLDTGIYYTIVFVEATDANDGSPPDHYDTPKPPLYLPPFIRAWFTDNLPTTYDVLSHDYRLHPSQEKTWKLHLQWTPTDYISSTTMTISWNRTRLHQSPYAHIMLCSTNQTPFLDMLTSSSYSFNCSAMTPQEFFIHATTTTYILNTTISGMGDLTSTPQQSSYYPGTSIHLKAIPKSNWLFYHWTGDIVGKNPSQIIQMNADKNIQAHFIINDTTPPHIHIDHPIHGLYLHGRLLHRYRMHRKPIIIGSLQITINAEDSHTSIDHLELYIDNELKETTNTSYLSFTWEQDRIRFFKHRHTLTVIAYDQNDNIATQHINVLKFR